MGKNKFSRWYSFWFLKKLLTQKEQIMSKKFLQTSSVLTLIGISFFSFSANSMNPLQRDLDINQRGGNPIPQNYPQPARGGRPLHQQNQLQRDLDINQRGGNPIPQNYPQPARGGRPLHQQNQLQRDLDINQRGGNPIPQNYPQPTRGGGQLQGNDDYDNDGFLEDYPDMRNKEEKKYDNDVYTFGKRNKLYKTEDGSDPRTSDDEDNV